MVKEPSLERQTLTVDEVAKILGVGRASAYECVRSGRLASVRVSERRIVVSRSALERFINNGGEDAK